MGRPRRPVMSHEILRLIDLDLDNKMIADMVEVKFGRRPTSGYLSLVRGRYCRPPLRQSRSDMIPWTVPRRHQHLFPAVMLRIEDRVRKHEKVDPELLEKWTSWRQRLDAANQVVHYEEGDPTDQGWYYYQRTDEDDPNDIIRRPKKKD